MRTFILASAAVIVIGGAAGLAATKAGAQPDPAATMMIALNDAVPGTGPSTPAARAQPLEDADPADAALLDPPPPVDADAMVLAQNAPPPPGPGPGPGLGPGPGPGPGPGMPPPPPGMPGHPMMGGHPGMPGGWGHRPMWHRAAMFGLFYRKDDKALTPADVQKIAEAFLLWQGNRDWKVTQVAAGPDGQIGFAFATADGGVIARFTMDSKTGRLQRVG